MKIDSKDSIKLVVFETGRLFGSVKNKDYLYKEAEIDPSLVVDTDGRYFGLMRVAEDFDLPDCLMVTLYGVPVGMFHGTDCTLVGQILQKGNGERGIRFTGCSRHNSGGFFDSMDIGCLKRVED